MLGALFLITNNNGEKNHVVANDLNEIQKIYDIGFKSLEVIDEKPIVLSDKKNEILLECLNFIETGANTQSNEKRIELEDKIRDILGL